MNYFCSLSSSSIVTTAVGGSMVRGGNEAGGLSCDRVN